MVKRKSKRETNKGYKAFVKKGKISSNWQAIRNLTDNANGTNAKAKALRELLFKKTGITAFKEKNFQKFRETGKGTPISVKLVRHAHTIIKTQTEKVLKREYEATIKDNILLEYSKAYHHAIKKKDRRKTPFQKWLKSKKTADLRAKIERLERRALPYDKFIKSNQALIEHIDTMQDIAEMYNSPD